MKYPLAQIALGLCANALVVQGYAVSSAPTETPCETVVVPSKSVATVVVSSKHHETSCEEVTTTFVTSKYVVTSVVTTKSLVASSMPYVVLPTTDVGHSSMQEEETPCETVGVSSSKMEETPYKAVVVPSSKPKETPYKTIIVSSSYPAPSKPAVSSAQPPKPIASSAPPSKPATTQSAPHPSSTTITTLSACPADLKGNYEYPHLIIPVDSKQPNKAPGTSYFGTITNTTCTIFNFDIPTSYSGKTCTLAFLFPLQSQLETSSFTFSGQGKVEFSKLASPATQGTSYANQPAKAQSRADLGSFTLAPGTSYSIASTTCAAGQTVAYKLCGTGDLALHYFQDYNPSPIGLYIRQC